MRTIKQVLKDSAAERPDATVVRHKVNGQWVEVSYRQLLMRAAQVSQILADAGIRPGDRVALYRENSADWIETYFGIISIGAVAVPIDAKLQGQEVAHILMDSQARVLFSSVEFYRVIERLMGHQHHIEAIVLRDASRMQPPPPPHLGIVDYEELMAGASEKVDAPDSAFGRIDPEEESIASLIYTSGTTGRPKGAMLTHRNFVSNAEAAMQCVNVQRTDNFLLVLPLHHAFAFTANLLLPVAAGAEISLIESLRTMGENMAETKPTVLIAVPLLLEKLDARIQAAIDKSKVGGLLVKMGLGKIIAGKIIAKLGGRIRLIVSGAAPCDPDLLRRWNKMGLTVREGYGLTETAPVLTINTLERNKPGTVGIAMPGIELTIVDPNEQGIGEVAARGDNVMFGYFNNKEATDEIFRDGALLTGDLGFIDDEGFLTITGRKKNLIVNREGKNIYPEEVESYINKSPYILESVVLGYRDPLDKAGERVGVIAVPDQDAISLHKGKLTDDQVEQLVRSEIKRMVKDISEYKRPRKIQVQFEELEKTSTAKIKRYRYAIDTRQMDA
ncbi:MAG TPA: AMP-binding protein [Kiritimatiellia bacterium]|nr:AMP-binding protein [Kiritimatiellia bacterium]